MSEDQTAQLYANTVFTTFLTHGSVEKVVEQMGGSFASVSNTLNTVPAYRMIHAFEEDGLFDAAESLRLNLAMQRGLSAIPYYTRTNHE